MRLPIINYQGNRMKCINILLFENFTMLDALGPAEVFSRLPQEFRLAYVSVEGGAVSGSTGFSIMTRPLAEIEANDILLVPGGFSTRQLVADADFIARLAQLADAHASVLAVCTGAALLAVAGVLKHRRATSNKKAWDWVVQLDTDVLWQRRARWLHDDKYYTSSGVAAGIDMSLGFIADQLGLETARQIGHAMEYVWNEDSRHDPFA
jgi:putative intracellular protease/amidase